jgi:hypothetical protein
VIHEADPDQDLLSLLRGELGRVRSHELAGHLRECESCRLALVDVAEVHGALTAAGRLLRPATEESFDPLQAAGRTPVVGQPDQRFPAGARAGGTDALPPLRVPHRRRAITGRLVAGIAAAVLVVAGLGIGSVVLSNRAGQPVTVTASRQVDLRPVTGSATGRVSMQAPGAQTDMTISTKGLPDTGAGRFYYAWLFDPQTKKMLPLGVVSAHASMHFGVATDLVQRYHAVDISLQADNGNPAHSATSVLRAQY